MIDAAPDYLAELIAAKVEREPGDGVLDEAQAASALPDAATAYDALHDFVVRTRLER